MLRYKIINIQVNTAEISGQPIKFDVLATEVATNKEVRLTNISLPGYAKAGDLIRWAEHKFYDVIDADGNFVLR